MAPRKTLVAKATFVTEVDGSEQLVAAGTRVAADHPLVKGREAHFEPEAEPATKPTRRRRTARK